ncbi:MAG: hypothetical protein RTU92_13395 [Candidatus Thorarchaeota archaeon]
MTEIASYNTSFRTDARSYTRSWYIWIMGYILVYIATLILNVDAPAILQFMQIDIGDILPSAYQRFVLSFFVTLVIMGLLIVAFEGAIVYWWYRDKATLRKEIAQYPTRLRALVGQSSLSTLSKLEDKSQSNLWELIFLKNYIRLLETRIRQSDVAPAMMTEVPIKWSPQYFQIPDDFFPPLTSEENDILMDALESESSSGWWKRRWWWIAGSKSQYIRLLIEGVSIEDYQTRRIVEFAEWLYSLTQDCKDYDRLFNEESIKSVIRLADKQYDFKLIEKSKAYSNGLRNWTTTWSDTEKHVLLEDATKIPLFELTDVQDINVNLRYDSPETSFQMTSSTLELSGYHVIPKVTNGKNQYVNRIELRERTATHENLERRHRILLEDLFNKDFRGSTIRLLDASNIMMSFQSYARRQYTINEIVDFIKKNGLSSNDTSEINRALLRVNLLSQLVPTLSRIDDVPAGRTLATSGLLGLDSLKEIRLELENYTKFLLEGKREKKNEDADKQETSGIQEKERIPVANNLAVPQLTEFSSLHEIKNTEKFVLKRTIAWAATGGGAWILKEDLLDTFTAEVEKPHVDTMYLFFHHPLRERVFLEVLTHKNYHYVSEIIKNRIQFQLEMKERNINHLEMIWSRESYHPSSLYILLNKDSNTILDEITQVHKVTNDADCCFMMTKSHMLFRNPVNGLKLWLAENSKALSPLAAYCHDITLRQRTYEKVADCISNVEGLISNGRPTALCLSVNWLGPLEFDEEIGDDVDFERHCFSDPESWFQQGFLELLVRETKSAYALLKVLDGYAKFLQDGSTLPFRMTQDETHLRIEEDLRHLTKAYDDVCDFLSGGGDFTREGVTAVSGDNGYLDWLSKALQQLPEIGRALNCEDEFTKCVDACKKWLKLLRTFLNERDTILVEKIDSTLNPEADTTKSNKSSTS